MLMGFQWDLVACQEMGIPLERKNVWHFLGGNTNDYITSEFEGDSFFSDKPFVCVLDHSRTRFNVVQRRNL